MQIMQSYPNLEQYKLEQLEHCTSGEHPEIFLVIILTLAYNLHICRFKPGPQIFLRYANKKGYI